MKQIRLFIKPMNVVFLYVFFSLQSAYGDDTEIFRPENININPDAKPNVLFVLDTSGSMAWDVPGAPADDDRNRMQVLKDVMVKLIDKLDNINVGLMRFQNGNAGGSVLFPVSNLDKIDNAPLVVPLNNGGNDASEDSGGQVTLDASVLEVDDGNTVGLRFENIAVPQGANITSAKLTLSANANSLPRSNLTIQTELSDDPAAFTTNDNDISNRVLSSGPTGIALWQISDISADEPYESPNLNTIVDQVTSLNGWCGGNNMTFVIKGDAKKKFFHSYEGASPLEGVDVPKLVIEFDGLKPGGNGCISGERTYLANSNHVWEREKDRRRTRNNKVDNDVDMYLGNYRNRRSIRNYSEGVGFSFTGVNIPKRATIISAHIELTPYVPETGTGETIIYGLAHDGSVGPTDFDLLYNSPRVGGVSWPLARWTVDSPVQSPAETRTVVQQIVNTSDWDAGDTMSFYLEGQSGYHRASPDSVKLVVKYRGTYQTRLSTKRDELKNIVQELPTSGNTPIAGALVEATRYFRGESAYYGLTRYSRATNRVSVPEAMVDVVASRDALNTPADCSTNSYSSSDCASERYNASSHRPTYKSPITYDCQPNHIIYLSDGEPTVFDRNIQDYYNQLTGDTCRAGNSGSDCAKKIAQFLRREDQKPGVEGSYVTVHTISFAQRVQLLQDMALEGAYNPGTFRLATNEQGLLKALENATQQVTRQNSSFVSAGVSINQLNRVTHNDELYFSLFRPETGRVWPGNLKRYRLLNNQIVDFNENNATEDGKFLPSALSWWPEMVQGRQLIDGDEVGKGGIAGQLSTDRTVYTNINMERDGSANLTDSSNTFDANDPDKFNLADLGVATEQERQRLVYWVTGSDPDLATTTPTPIIEPHNVIGDPLHSQPTVVSYSDNFDGPPQDKSDIRQRVFVGTNHGFLHVVDTNDGQEKWSFIPKELLPKLSNIYRNAGDYDYGLDGSITINFVNDVDNDGVVDIGTDTVYLYVGMRRGGSSYYALDISNPDAPRLLFIIDPSKTGFAQLGETWSKPLVADIKFASATQPTNVIIFGGGYDTEQDDSRGQPSATDSVGNRVFIADAATGEHLWNSHEAGVQAPRVDGVPGLITEMNGVPSNITGFDIDGDGLMDHFYASDTKAQIFRFDVDNSAGTITGGRIAHLQTANDAENNRRFYYQPDVALIRGQGETFASVSIGSGYRAGPLDITVKDNFYVLKDKGVLSKIFDMDVSRDQLVDVTRLVGDSNNDGQTDAAAEIENTNARGWYLTFSASGEKVIERSITFNNTVMFTSYSPPGTLVSVCEGRTGVSRLYQLDIFDGNPFFDRNEDGRLTESDRTMNLNVPGIAPPIRPIRTPSGTIGIIDREIIPLPPTPEALMGTRWRKNNDATGESK